MKTRVSLKYSVNNCGSLWIFSFFCFWSTAILSISSQTRFICKGVLLSLNFQESFSFFSIDFLCVFPKKRLCWLVVLFQIVLFLVPIAKKMTVLFYETILTGLFDDGFLYFKTILQLKAHSKAWNNFELLKAQFWVIQSYWERFENDEKCFFYLKCSFWSCRKTAWLER